MEFNDVLLDLAQHAIDDANVVFDEQQRRHDFKPFITGREVISDSGHTFRVKVEFEPDPMSALLT